MLNIETVRSQLVAAVEASGEKGMAGSYARSILGPAFSPTDFGSPNFSHFVRTNIPELCAIGNSGGDILWGLRSAISGAAVTTNETVLGGIQAAELPGALDAWRTWVSPASPFALAVRRDGSGEIRPIRREQLTPDEHLIEPIEATTLRRIAMMFAEQVSNGELRARLLEVVADPSASWWKQWNTVIQTVPGQYLIWSTHRTQQLLKELHERLAALGVDESAIARLLDRLDHSRRQSFVERKISITETSVARADTDQVPGPSLRTTSNPPGEPVVEMRKIVSYVVERMTDVQLRELVLPVGLVVDAVRTNKA